jgi:predicted  nucleic acid-binding Zn-ribbon protein
LENMLRHLYEMQQIDLALDELEEMKGDLPAEIQALEEKHAALSARLASLEESMRTSFAHRDLADSDIIGLRDKLEVYKKQQFAVRNNREYDALTREMDTATETIARLEKEMELLEAKATAARSEIAEGKQLLEGLNAELEEKQAALAEVSKTTEDEELRYKHERQKIVVRVSTADLAAYERIRKAKRGKAVVPIKRSACGGCFAKVPPQKLLELRQNKKLYTCEHCGRILVSDEIVESSTKFA